MNYQEGLICKTSSLTNGENVVMVLGAFTPSAEMSVRRCSLKVGGLTRTSRESTRDVRVVWTVPLRTKGSRLCLMQVLQELLASQRCMTTLYPPAAACFGGESYHQRDGAPPRYHTDEKYSRCSFSGKIKNSAREG